MERARIAHHTQLVAFAQQNSVCMFYERKYSIQVSSFGSSVNQWDSRIAIEIIILRGTLTYGIDRIRSIFDFKYLFVAFHVSGARVIHA